MTRLHVLVVDDEPFIRSTVTMLLTLEGHGVDGAANGADGLRLAEASTPDLILSDLYMPQMDGLALMAAVRANPALAHTRVVLLTADTQAASDHAADALQPDAWLHKPFTRDQLLQVLRPSQRD